MKLELVFICQSLTVIQPVIKLTPVSCYKASNEAIFFSIYFDFLNQTTVEGQHQLQHSSPPSILRCVTYHSVINVCGFTQA